MVKNSLNIFKSIKENFKTTLEENEEEIFTMNSIKKLFGNLIKYLIKFYYFLNF